MVKREKEQKIVTELYEETDVTNSKTTSYDKHEVIIKQNKDNRMGYEFAPGELTKVKWLFFIIGYAGIVNWPTTTNCIQTVYATVYNNPAGANTMLLPYLICSTLFGIIRMYYKHIALWGTTLGVFLLFFTNLAIPMTVQFASVESGPKILHIVIAFVGVGVSLVIGNFGAYSFLMPCNLFGLLTTGNGLAGLFAFLIWQFLIRVPYDSSVVEDIKACLWIYYGFNMISILILGGIYIYLLKKPWFKGSIRIFDETKNIIFDIEDDSEQSSEQNKYKGLTLAASTSIGVRPFFKMMKKPFPFMILCGLSFFITYSIYPNIGPYGWEGSYDNRSFLVGIYQVLDLIGRYIPNIGPKFLLPVKVSAFAIFLRFIFYPIWIAMAMNSTGLASSFIFEIFLMTCFAMLSGYLTVLPIIHVARDLRSVAERGFMGLISFTAIQLWLCLGIAMSNILLLIFDAGA